MIDNRFSLLEVEDNDNQPQGNKRKKKESTPNQITPAQRAKINERKKKQKAIDQPITKRQADPNEVFTPVGGREDKDKAKGPKKLTREEFERERKANPDSPLLKGASEDDAATTRTDDGSFEYRTRGGKTRNRGKIQDTDKQENQRSPSNRYNRGGQGRRGGKNQSYRGGKNQGVGQTRNQGGQTRNQGGYKGNENRPKKYQGSGTPATGGSTQKKKKFVSEPPVHGRPDERKPRTDVDSHKGGRGGNTSWGDDVKEQKKRAEDDENNNDELSDDDKNDDEVQQVVKSDYIFFTEPDEEGKEKKGVSQRKGYNSFIKDMEEQQNDINKLLQKHSVETKKVEGAVGLSDVETQKIENISKKSHDIIIDQENDSWMVKKNSPALSAEKKRKKKNQPTYIPVTDVLNVRQRRHKGINMPIERNEDDEEKPERFERKERPERFERKERPEKDNKEDTTNVDSPVKGKRRNDQGYSDNRDQGNSPNWNKRGQGKRGQGGVGKKVPNIKNEEIFPPLSQDPVVNKAPSPWEGKKFFDLS